MSSPGDRLRNALHAAADSVEPGARGLEQIRARTTRPRALPVVMLEAAWAAIAQALLRGWDASQSWLVGDASARSRPGAPAGAARRRWLRPLAAAAAVVFVVAAALTVTHLPTTGRQAATVGPYATGGPGGPGGSPGPGGTAPTGSLASGPEHRTSPGPEPSASLTSPGGRSGSPSPTGPGRPHPQSSPNCSASPGGPTPTSPAPSSPSPTASSPTPSGSASPTPTASPSATTTQTSSAGSGATGSAGPESPPGAIGVSHGPDHHRPHHKTGC